LALGVVAAKARNENSDKRYYVKIEVTYYFNYQSWLNLCGNNQGAVHKRRPQSERRGLSSGIFEIYDVSALRTDKGKQGFEPVHTFCKQGGDQFLRTSLLVNHIMHLGQGFDRHLFGLRHTAEKIMELETPAIFKDYTFQVMNHIVLSTSTLASHAVNFGGFAPVVPDGFGVGYGVREDWVGCNITSYDNRDVSQLVDAIMTSLKDIYTVLEGK